MKYSVTLIYSHILSIFFFFFSKPSLLLLKKKEGKTHSISAFCFFDFTLPFIGISIAKALKIILSITYLILKYI